MEILILNWRDIRNPKRGGAEIILYELCRRLVKKGHDLTWFCSAFPGSLAQETTDGIKIIRRGNKFTVYWHAFWYYKRLLSKPDLVLDCINTICWQTPLYIEKEKRLLYANQSAREVFFYEFPLLIALFGYLLEPFQYLSYKSTKAVCYSKSIREDLVSFGLPKDNITIFPLGIDHARYNPDKKFSDPTFVFIARFVKNKRAGLCIKAISTVIKKFPKAKLYLVGYGDEEKNLQRLIDASNLGANVTIINKNNVFFEKNNKDIKVSLMQGAWALILPSVKEGWGMVVTEAAACGTPAIVTDVTGLRDSTNDGKTGIVISHNPTPDELAQAMMTIIDDKVLRGRLSKGALAFAKDLTWEKSFAQFYRILQKSKVS